ncbi:MAG: imidazole glycerol phosphate synthase subunit HisH [Synechococcaceae cyanobacterium SM2_3_1]|nr:imidazole glycerol phosphate synthase subunit HisH [Synechococcaceae cyanobacterium SM2_3_1]
MCASPRLALIDYDTGNLHSACKGLEVAGATVEIISDPRGLECFDGLVLPGDGAFDPAIQELRRRGFVEPLHKAIAQGTPFLGICIGLQLLFDRSEEGQDAGLGIIAGHVARFQAEPRLTIPHMGWNQLQFTQQQAILWQGIEVDPWVYFVHAYHGVPTDPDWIAATVRHGHQTVVAAVARDQVMATQFHPEKSGLVGLKMLQNFVEYVIQGKELSQGIMAPK